MTDYERITDDNFFDGAVRESHEYRYKLASRYIKPDDVVLDAACGTKYGEKFLGGKKYIGVDKIESADIVADLNTWEPDFDFDVFVSFETLEHLTDWKHLIEVGKKAKRIMCISTPIVPTVGGNPFHLQDFTFDQITGELISWGWTLVHSEIQNNEYGIWVLKRV